MSPRAARLAQAAVLVLALVAPFLAPRWATQLAFLWLMVRFALIQVACSVGAVYYGGKVAMSFGRDLRSNLFHKVTDFSAREVGSFGAPSLITRITNDVQQVQFPQVITQKLPLQRWQIFLVDHPFLEALVKWNQSPPYLL